MFQNILPFQECVQHVAIVVGVDAGWHFSATLSRWDSAWRGRRGGAQITQPDTCSYIAECDGFKFHSCPSFGVQSPEMVVFAILADHGRNLELREVSHGAGKKESEKPKAGSRLPMLLAV